MGYEKEANLYLFYYFIILEKKDFQENTPKIQMLMFRLAQTSHFGLWDIIPPAKSEVAFHIYFVKYENTLTCKMLVGTRGGGGGGNDVLKIFF